MGVTCECENKSLNISELKDFFNRKKNYKIQEEEKEIINKEKQINRKLLNKFIVKNITRIFQKEKIANNKARAQSIFFEQEILNFKYDKSYFEEELKKKLLKFFEQKNDIMKDLFAYNLINSLNSFPKLRDKVSQYYNNNIFNNHKEYLNDLILFLTENNLIKKRISNPSIMKQLLAKMTLQEALSGFSLNNKLGNNNNSKENNDNINSINPDNILVINSKNSQKEGEKNNSKEDIKNIPKIKFNLSWEQINIENLIKKEIDNFFDVCFGSPKRNDEECQKKSIFLNILIFQENKKNPKLNFTWELRKLIRLLYYIYLLKKYKFLSDTNKCFFKMKPRLIKRKSNIKDKVSLNKKASFSRNENNLKIKYLKNALSEKTKTDTIIPLETKLIESMSSIMSEEEDKEYNSIISATIDFKLLKTLTKNEDKKTNNLVKEESKLNEVVEKKSILRLSNNDIFNTHKKNSIQNYIKREPNLKLGKNLRPNIRARTGKKNKSVIFSEYYNGQFDESVYLYAGLGTLVSQNYKKLYYGTFRYGVKEGMGLLYTIKDEKNMEYYMGEFRNNKINGYGIKIKINELEFFFQEGIFEGDCLTHGKCKKIKKRDKLVFTYNYEGEMKNNKFDGNGKLTEKKYLYKKTDKSDEFYTLIQQTNYKGKFANGKRNGQGKEIYNNNIDATKNYEYEGNFANGLKNGFGIINYCDNSFVKRYEGFFKNDNPFQIYGIATFKSGDIYEGFFENSIKDYLGVYSFCDNNNSNKIIEQYFGGFLDDFKNGLGKTIVDDVEQKMLIGPYKKGEKEGQFEKFIFKNEIVEKSKKRRGCVTTDNFFTTDGKNRRNEILPRIQIKTFPIYEENEIIDINNNYYYDNISND